MAPDPSSAGRIHTKAPPQDSEVLKNVQARQQMYEALTRLPFKVRLGERTAFDHTTTPGTVVLGVAQLGSLGVTDPSKIDFCVLHELGHFTELAQDPDGYKTVIDEGSRSDGLGKAYFRFYNALMDIYVNRNTRDVAPEYRADKEYTDDIKQMYTNHFFANRDFTELPLSTQYSFALLNIGMGVGDDLKVSPEVQKSLDNPLQYLGKELTTKELIDTYLLPVRGRRSTKQWQATITQRKRVIDATLRKRFEKLIEEDKNQGGDPNQGDPNGDIEGFEASPEELQKAYQQAKEIQKKKQKTPEEEAADSREKDVSNAVRSELSEQEAENFAKTHRKVHPQIVEVANILKSIVRQEIDYRRQLKGYFKAGEELDIHEAVERFHTLQSNPTEARVFQKYIYQQQKTEQPQHIRIWGAVDLSGSMDRDIGMLRELCVIFGGAIQMISDGAALEQHNLKASLSIHGYNDNAFEIVPFTDTPTVEDIARGYKKLVAEGGTYEADALRAIQDELTKRERDENIVDIIVAITDGDTREKDESISLVDSLKKNHGIKALAFKFYPGSQRSDTVRPAAQGSYFQEIWREDAYEIQGAHNVVPAVRAGLRE